MVEGTEEIGLRILYSPVSPVGSLDCFGDRLQNTLPYLRRQSQRLVIAFLRLLSTRVGLNARPKASGDNNQFANLVLGAREGGDKTRKRLTPERKVRAALVRGPALTFALSSLRSHLAVVRELPHAALACVVS